MYASRGGSMCKSAMDENGRLNRSRSTENSRLILALTAMGKDVTHVAGRNLLDGLDSMSFITKQSVNGPVGPAGSGQP